MEGPAESPERIAHRAGNNRLALRRALAREVDWIEVDIWWHHGRIVARHERALWRLPVVYDKWRLHVQLGRPLCLPELLAATEGGPRLFLDYKGLSRRLPEAVVEGLRRDGAVGRAAICGQYWPALDATATLEPALQVVYSFGSTQHLEAMRNRPAALPPIRAASVAHWLLTPSVVHEFFERGIRVFAWTVNDPARARALVQLGVAGIISDDLDLLSNLSLAA